jgi:hypothetical protein
MAPGATPERPFPSEMLVVLARDIQPIRWIVRTRRSAHDQERVVNKPKLRY